MILGSLVLHALILAAFFLWPETDQNTGPEDVAANDVSMVFQTDSTAPASTKSPDAQQTPTVAHGSQTDQTTPQPKPQTATPSPASAAATPSPSTPPTPQTPPAPPAPAPTPPPPQTAQTPPPPTVEASIPPPPEATEPETTPPPPPPTSQPEVSLTPPPPETPAVPQPPSFVMPQPPPPLPPLPQPRPPRRIARPLEQRSPSGFPMPQNWALNSAPSPLASHGFDAASQPRGSQDDESYRHIGGADPGPDWMSELHRWAAAHAYYPEEAAQEGQQGSVTVQVEIDHFGHVLNVDMISRSGSQWLDLAWLGEWRGAKVPSFPQGTMGDTTTLQYTINYILIHR